MPIVQWVSWWKNFENRFIFPEDMEKNKCDVFFLGGGRHSVCRNTLQRSLYCRPEMSRCSPTFSGVWAPPFVGPPFFQNMLSMPKSSSVLECIYIWVCTLWLWKYIHHEMVTQPATQKNRKAYNSLLTKQSRTGTSSNIGYNSILYSISVFENFCSPLNTMLPSFIYFLRFVYRFGE